MRIVAHHWPRWVAVHSRRGSVRSSHVRRRPTGRHERGILTQRGRFGHSFGSWRAGRRDSSHSRGRRGFGSYASSAAAARRILGSIRISLVLFVHLVAVRVVILLFVEPVLPGRLVTARWSNRLLKIQKKKRRKNIIESVPAQLRNANVFAHAYIASIIHHQVLIAPLSIAHLRNGKKEKKIIKKANENEILYFRFLTCPSLSSRLIFFMSGA